MDKVITQLIGLLHTVLFVLFQESDLDMLGSESDNEENEPKSSTSDRKPIENNEKPKDEAIKQ